MSIILVARFECKQYKATERRDLLFAYFHRSDVVRISLAGFSNTEE